MSAAQAGGNGVTHCANCGRAFGAAAHRCVYCGAVKGRQCPKCKAVVPAGAEICYVCKSDIPSSVPNFVLEMPSVAEPPQPPPPPSVESSRKHGKSKAVVIGVLMLAILATLICAAIFTNNRNPTMSPVAVAPTTMPFPPTTTTVTAIAASQPVVVPTTVRQQLAAVPTTLPPVAGTPTATSVNSVGRTAAISRPAIVPLDAVQFGGHWYKACVEKVTWSQAKKKCEEVGGHLVCIESKDENEFLTKGIAAGFEWWVGGSDFGARGKWQWVNRHPFEFTNWAKGEPRNEDPVNSLVLQADYRGGAWNDGAAGFLAGYICEWAAEAPPPYPVGEWHITYSTDAIRKYGIAENGVVRVLGFQHIASGRIMNDPFPAGMNGKIAVRNGQMLLQLSGENKVERLSILPDGRLFVEHWNPALNFPASPPTVTGIGVRSK